MTKSLLTNNLWSTTEYKVDTLETIKITTLNTTGIKTRNYPLYNLDVEEKISRPRYVLFLLTLTFIFVAVAYTTLNYKADLSYNSLVVSILVFTSCLLALTLSRLKAYKYFIYTDTYTNKKLFELALDNQNSSINSFIHSLNSLIINSKVSDPTLTVLKSNSKLEYETNVKNVTNLFNTGMIDESLYNRINQSMHDSVFGDYEKKTHVDNIVYLK